MDFIPKVQHASNLQSAMKGHIQELKHIVVGRISNNHYVDVTMKVNVQIPNLDVQDNQYHICLTDVQPSYFQPPKSRKPHRRHHSVRNLGSLSEIDGSKCSDRINSEARIIGRKIGSSNSSSSSSGDGDGPLSSNRSRSNVAGCSRGTPHHLPDHVTGEMTRHTASDLPDKNGKRCTNE
jgi:hypothetical protein